MGGRPLMLQPCAQAQARVATRGDEVDDLMALLLAHADPAAGSPADIDAVARALAVASLGDNHLWQDLQLPSRTELSALFAHWFPALKARNDRDMKWKKFLYKQLCEREALFICKAPSCAVCSDRPVCFGPELAAEPAPGQPALTA
ncbi:nitrogen fixation protein NifQ [Ideonella sp. A 288]|uniref:nitrogen fixation protein NifQ n=1 Tax=Ideonella sp. A 288 TaxID=1962181 RepID=UPI000B4B17A8|nr:nitrogen fixation protein NifQ [Ideonella sp. A 288]